MMMVSLSKLFADGEGAGKRKRLSEKTFQSDQSPLSAFLKTWICLGQNQVESYFQVNTNQPSTTFPLLLRPLNVEKIETIFYILANFIRISNQTTLR